jgi:hypothetical protein
MADLAASIAAAVDVLHGSSSTAESRAAANTWLLEAASQPAAPAAAEALLAAPAGTVSDVALAYAAGIVGRAGATVGIGAVEPMLHLCVNMASRQVVMVLAHALTGIAISAKAEDQLLRGSAFPCLETPKQIAVLQALAANLEQCGSAEELQARPTAVAASVQALTILEAALMAPVEVAPPTAVKTVLRCLSSWGACGCDYARFHEEHYHLLQALIHSMRLESVCFAGESIDGERVETAALAGSVLRSSLLSSVETGAEIELHCLDPLRTMLTTWTALLPMLGAPTVDASGETDGGGAHANECAELASVLCAIAALLVEALADMVVDSEPASDVAREAFELLLCGCSHVLAGPAELAAEGWIAFEATLPTSRSQAPEWSCGLFSQVAQRAVARCAFSHLHLGTGEDAHDLNEWRERCTRPLLGACSRQVGGTAWLTLMENGIHQASQKAQLLNVDFVAFEAWLFAGACSDPSYSQRSRVSESARREMLVRLQRSIEQCMSAGAAISDEMAGMISSQARACMAAVSVAIADG